MLKTYSELIQLSRFEDRFEYLKLHGEVCEETFGFDRYLNQRFYKSNEWKRVRDFVIRRDMGLDLGCSDHYINGKIIVHHMNPMTIEDIQTDPSILLNPEYLISVSLETHNALHYGDYNLLNKDDIIERSPNDTILWRK